MILKDLFAQDPERFKKFSKEYTASNDPATTFLLDYSKNLVTEPVLATLFNLVREAGVEQTRDEMFSGKHINTSEDRAVLHVALRNFSKWSIPEPGTDAVFSVLDHIRPFTESVRS